MAEVCSAWTTPDKLCCEGGGDVVECDGDVTPLVYEWTDEQVILAASNILFAKTCFRFPGTCTSEVWPCVSCGCKRHPCACSGVYSYLELPTDYEVLSVTSVTIDGLVVDPSVYRIERRNLLVRVDGERWPCRNSFGLPDSNDPEIIVEYEHGRVPPIELQMAAAELACELKKACNGQSCALPAHVSSIVSRGVEMEFTDLAELMKSGATGLPMVDHAISVWSPCPQTSMVDPAAKLRGWSVS